MELRLSFNNPSTCSLWRHRYNQPMINWVHDPGSTSENIKLREILQAVQWWCQREHQSTGQIKGQMTFCFGMSKVLITSLASEIWWLQSTFYSKFHYHRVHYDMMYWCKITLSYQHFENSVGNLTTIFMISAFKRSCLLHISRQKLLKIMGNLLFPSCSLGNLELEFLLPPARVLSPRATGSMESSGAAEVNAWCFSPQEGNIGSGNGFDILHWWDLTLESSKLEICWSITLLKNSTGLRLRDCFTDNFDTKSNLKESSFLFNDITTNLYSCLDSNVVMTWKIRKWLLY